MMMDVRTVIKAESKVSAGKVERPDSHVEILESIAQFERIVNALKLKTQQLLGLISSNTGSGSSSWLSRIKAYVWNSTDDREDVNTAVSQMLEQIDPNNQLERLLQQDISQLVTACDQFVQEINNRIHQFKNLNEDNLQVGIYLVSQKLFGKLEIKFDQYRKLIKSSEELINVSIGADSALANDEKEISNLLTTLKAILHDANNRISLVNKIVDDKFSPDCFQIKPMLEGTKKLLQFNNDSIKRTIINSQIAGNVDLNLNGETEVPFNQLEKCHVLYAETEGNYQALAREASDVEKKAQAVYVLVDKATDAIYKCEAKYRKEIIAKLDTYLNCEEVVIDADQKKLREDVENILNIRKIELKRLIDNGNHLNSYIKSLKECTEKNKITLNQLDKNLSIFDNFIHYADSLPLLQLKHKMKEKWGVNAVEKYQIQIDGQLYLFNAELIKLMRWGEQCNDLKTSYTDSLQLALNEILPFNVVGLEDGHKHMAHVYSHIIIPAIDHMEILLSRAQAANDELALFVDNVGDLPFNFEKSHVFSKVYDAYQSALKVKADCHGYSKEYSSTFFNYVLINLNVVVDKNAYENLQSTIKLLIENYCRVFDLFHDEMNIKNDQCLLFLGYASSMKDLLIKLNECIQQYGASQQLEANIKQDLFDKSPFKNSINNEIIREATGLNLLYANREWPKFPDRYKEAVIRFDSVTKLIGNWANEKSVLIKKQHKLNKYIKQLNIALIVWKKHRDNIDYLNNCFAQYQENLHELQLVKVNVKEEQEKLKDKIELFKNSANKAIKCLSHTAPLLGMLERIVDYRSSIAKDSDDVALTVNSSKLHEATAIIHNNGDYEKHIMSLVDGLSRFKIKETDINNKIFSKMRREFLYNRRSCLLIEKLQKHAASSITKANRVQEFITRLSSAKSIGDIDEMSKWLAEISDNNEIIKNGRAGIIIGRDSKTHEILKALHAEWQALVVREKERAPGSIGYALGCSYELIRQEYKLILQNGRSNEKRVVEKLQSKFEERTENIFHPDAAFDFAPEILSKIRQDYIEIQRCPVTSVADCRVQNARLECSRLIRAARNTYPLTADNHNSIVKYANDYKFTFAYQALKCHLERCPTKRYDELRSLWRRLNEIAFSIKHEEGQSMIALEDEKYKAMREEILTFYLSLRERTNGSAGYFFGRGSRLGDALRIFLISPQVLSISEHTFGLGFANSDVPKRRPDEGAVDKTAHFVSKLFCCKSK